MEKILISGSGHEKPKEGERGGRKGGARNKGRERNTTCCLWDQDKCFQSHIFHMTPSKSSWFDY